MASRDLRSLTPISDAGGLGDAAIVFGALTAGADEPSTYELGALKAYIASDRVKAPTEATARTVPVFVGTAGDEIDQTLVQIDTAGNVSTPAGIASDTRTLGAYDDIAVQSETPAAPAAGYVRLFSRVVGGVRRIGIIDEDDAVIELHPLLGDVFGPAGAVSDGHAVLFDGVSGKLLKSSGGAPSLVGHDHDDRYYTEAEVDGSIADAVSALTALLAGKSDVGHTHDDRYYTDGEIDTLLGGYQAALGFTAENVANKDTDITLSANSDTKYASQKAIKAYIDGKINDLVNSAPGTLDTLGEIAAQMAADESAVGALTTTVAGKLAKSSNLSDLTNVATARTNLGLAIGTNVQAYSANLTTFAAIAPSSNAQSLLGAANYAAMRALLDLEAGTDFYSKSATDAAFAAIGRQIIAGDGMTGGGTLAADRTVSMSANSRTGDIIAVIGDGQNDITTGTYGFIPLDFAAALGGWTVIGDVSGSIVLDVWKAAGAVPTNANSITASAKPTLSAAQRAASSTLTGWTTSFAAGDVLGFEVESVSGLKQVTLALKFVKA